MLIIQRSYLLFLLVAILLPIFWKRLNRAGLGRTRLLMIVESLCIFTGLLGFVAGQAKQASAIHGGFTCQSHMKALGRAIVEYTQDWDETFPPAVNWSTLTSKYVSGGGFNVSAEEAPHCPEATSPYGYAFNSALGGVAIKNLKSPKETVLLFEADSTSLNAVGGKDQLTKTLRHYGKNNFWFSYGFVRAKDAKETKTLHWRAEQPASTVDTPAKDD